MNVDNAVNWVVTPLLKYPVLVYVVFWTPNVKISLLLILYSVLLKICIALNKWYKCQGNEPWKSLEELENAVVLVTGGSHGLGRSIIMELLNRYKHVKVINLDLQKSPSADTRVLDIQCDLMSSAALVHCIDEIKIRYGDNLSLIVNNAGIRAPYQYLKDSNEFSIQEVFAVNAFAPTRIIQELVPSNHQCYVVNITSTLGVLAPAKVSTYAASKAALIAFHNSYSLELSKLGISQTRSLLVLSGQLDTEMFGGFEPPLQFFAPVVDRRKLARDLIDCCERGQRGEICVPFYSNFAHLLMSLPLLPRNLVRKLSKMDDCLPQE
ncbi:hypothetical protein ZYGR_0H04250 [Zygosaccharomyces rouxii]|uniref:Uncharacterized protein n=1 Tax=Zygosaccharomyces rouxii TaxID=4956 RepID=A0A1Q2ZVW6_ZYGRO|nr:hypothetical protein ZYGR_0H04250 [Zygosaccharomyces rouxii]